MEFKDKVVLITGAGSGIGRVAAKNYAAEGAKVVVSDINAPNGEKVVKEIEAANGTALFIEADVSNYEAVQDLVQQTVTHFGRLDIAVNNAGIGGAMTNTTETSLENWEKVIAVNQTGVFYCMKEELKVMQQQGSGNIVNIASMAGMKGFPKQLAYTASKHAVIGMTKAAALEYIKFNIRVNAVCPVFTHSPLLEQMFEYKAGLKEKLLYAIPMRRYGEAQEVVEAILWLSSDKASFTTGLALPIDGGQSA